jgi:DNA-binding transcriptional MerR regulator
LLQGLHSHSTKSSLLEQNEQKLYYSIGEVAASFQVNVSLIRFWTNEFSSYIKPKTNKKGNRYYTPADVQLLKRIHYLVKEKGYTLEGAKENLKSKDEGGPDLFALKEKLIQHRQYLEKLHDDMDRISERLNNTI